MNQQFLMQKDVLIFLKRQTKGSVASRWVCVLLLYLNNDSLEPSGNICSGKEQQ